MPLALPKPPFPLLQIVLDRPQALFLAREPVASRERFGGQSGKLGVLGLELFQQPIGAPLSRRQSGARHLQHGLGHPEALGDLQGVTAPGAVTNEVIRGSKGRRVELE